ncbi:MAG: helix-turn-helix domain-containing protein, partial [Bacteroidota bacterium]
KERWKDLLMPFIMGYGPLLFFLISSLKNKELALKKILLHFIPFLIYLIIFLVLLLGLVKPTSWLLTILIKQVLILGILSFTGYSIWSVFIGRTILINKQKLVLIVFARVLFVFLIMLFVTIYFSNSMANNQVGIYWYRMLIYSCMLIGVLMIFSYVVADIFKYYLPITLTGDQGNIGNEQSPKYERSALTAVQLKLFEEKLIVAIKDEKLYLDHELTLTSLAQYLKMPNHHLTQVFSVQIKQSFYQYINGFRIQEACRLMIESTNRLSLEAIAEKSGFNAKVSFNRQFKATMGCTPSAYRHRVG